MVSGLLSRGRCGGQSPPPPAPHGARGPPARQTVCRRCPLCRRAARQRKRPSPCGALRRRPFASRSSRGRTPGNAPRRRATRRGSWSREGRDSGGLARASAREVPTLACVFDGASPAPDGPAVRPALILIAVVALVGIGTAEAWISNDQLSQLPGRARPALSSTGTVLTLIGIALSVGVYAVLGVFLARDGTRETAAVTIGAAVGAGAGMIGGTIRAYLIRDYLGEVLAGYGLAGLLIVTLGVFVALSIAVSVAAGASLTWLGFRRGRRRRTPRPPS